MRRRINAESNSHWNEQNQDKMSGRQKGCVGINPLICRRPIYFYAAKFKMLFKKNRFMSRIGGKWSGIST
ncbi:MAG: hypothetical protein C6W54_18220 [Bacillaceae bacterium]|nr:MAG: hypothetical protein C6W54_18220 [Bacillaceae bacterium]